MNRKNVYFWNKNKLKKNTGNTELKRKAIIMKCNAL